jgi:hypothetical protein
MPDAHRLRHAFTNDLLDDGCLLPLPLSMATR